MFEFQGRGQIFEVEAETESQIFFPRGLASTT